MASVDLLLDTTIVIDILRKHQPAITWLEGQSDRSIAISGYTVFEILAGARNKEEMVYLKNEMAKFSTFWPTIDEYVNAIDSFANLYLSHNIGILDILIGHTAKMLNTTIVSLNEKHFKPIVGLEVIVPY